MDSVVRVAQRISRTESEGPGTRYALWVQGCSIRCADCCNPEMFSDRGGELVGVEALTQEILATRDIEGVTFLGGEPFEQAAPLAELATRAREAGLSVMVFTGHVREDLEKEGDAAHRALIDAADLLADGPFEVAQPGSRWRWLGSQNQRMHFLSSRYAPDDPRFVAANTIDIHISGGKIEISGWAPLAKSIGVEQLTRRGRGRG